MRAAAGCHVRLLCVVATGLLLPLYLGRQYASVLGAIQERSEHIAKAAAEAETTEVVDAEAHFPGFYRLPLVNWLARAALH